MTASGIYISGGVIVLVIILLLIWAVLR